MILSARAKINLTLEIRGRRDDGYHEISSVMQSIDLVDRISLEPAKDLSLICDDETVVNGEMTMIPLRKAAELLRERSGYPDGAEIRMLAAGIPRAAGLGSSSAGPGVVMKGLNEMWSLGLSPDDLTSLAAELGSDMPFFIRGGTALVEGRGERVTPLPSPPESWLVLLVPPFGPLPDKTSRMYAMIRPEAYTDGTMTRRLVASLRESGPLHPEFLYNTFEGVAFDFFSQLGQVRDVFLEAGAARVSLAGAGPALFCLVADRQSGEDICKRMTRLGMGTLLVRTVREGYDGI